MLDINDLFLLSHHHSIYVPRYIPKVAGMSKGNAFGLWQYIHVEGGKWVIKINAHLDLAKGQRIHYSKFELVRLRYVDSRFLGVGDDGYIQRMNSRC